MTMCFENKKKPKKHEVCLYTNWFTLIEAPIQVITDMFLW